MRDETMGDVVAERTEAFGAGAAVREVTVRIGRPRRDPDPPGDWRCPVRLIGGDHDAVRWVHGVDSLQALALALRLAEILLDDLRARLGPADAG